MKKFLINWSLLTLSNIIYQILIFFVLIRIAKFLDPQIFGLFTIIITVVNVAQIISSIGLQKIVTREIARNPDYISYIAKIILLPIIFAFVVSAILLVMYLFHFENIRQAIVLISSLILLLSLSVWNYAEPFAFGIQKMNISAYLNIIFSTILFVIIFILPSRYFVLETVLILYSVIFLLKSLTYIIIEWQKKYFAKPISIPPDVNLKILLTKSSPSYLNLLLGVPTTLLPILFLGQLSGQTEVAYYSIGNKLSMPLNLIASNLFIAVFPVLSKLYSDNKITFKVKMKEIFKILIVVGFFISLCVGLFSREIILILLGSKYLPAIPVFTIQVWTTLNTILLTFIATLLFSADRENLLAKLSLFNAILIGLSSYIGSYYGSLGLSVSLWISMLIGMLFHWYFVCKVLDVKLDKYFYSILVIFISLSLFNWFMTEVSFIIKFVIVIISMLVLYTLNKYWFDINFKNIKT